MHKALFWVAVAVLQLDEVNLYSAGTALLEQNLHTLDTMRVFNDKVTRHTTPQCWRSQHILSISTMKHLECFIFTVNHSSRSESRGSVHGDQAPIGVALQADGSLCGLELQRQLQLCSGGPPS